EERRDLETLAPEARVVRQRQPEIPRPHDGHAHPAIEPEDLPEVPAKILDVVPDATDAELSEVGEVLSNLGRVQMELLRQRLGRDAAHAGSFESGQAAEVHRQAVGRQLGDRLDDLAHGRGDFVRLLHKPAIVAERSERTRDLGRSANITPLWPRLAPWQPPILP